MKQVVQDFKDGKIKIINVPVPSIEKGFVLVKNYYSLISVGTERSTVSVGKKNILGKAIARPDLFRKVVDTMKKEGIRSTMKRVKTRLDEYKLLGYSSSGRVIEVGEGVRDIKIGDLVACGGGNYAIHSEVISVPQNLCVKIPKGVGLKDAAFGTIGAIALQSVRQLDPKIGDNVGIIGLGLIGIITLQILKANGCNVFCIDIDKKNLEDAKRFGADGCGIISEDLILKVKNFTKSKYLDGIIISAGTQESTPVNLSAKILRDRGKVVILGNVGMNIERETFYMKELEILMSRSYGPGRYDFNYEEKGIDYPIGYVRWTEKRNIEAFLDFIKSKKVDVQSLITHIFKIDEAEKAYDLILKSKERFRGVLFEYTKEDESYNSKVFVFPNKKYVKTDKIKIGIIGAGNFGKTFIIPNIVKNKDVELIGISTQKVSNAMKLAHKYGFKYATGDYNDIIMDEDIDTVFILTRHNLHFSLTKECLKKGKNVFVEKPLAINMDDIEKLKEILQNSNGRLLVGFNRRFSPHSKKLKEFIGEFHGPINIIYRVNAGYLPEEHWLNDPDVGGGRIIGEACHFIDYLRFLTGSNIKNIYAFSSIEKDNKSIFVEFIDGSFGTIHYITIGDKNFPKERIEVFVDGKIFIIDDFKISEFSFKGSSKKFKTFGISKGYKEEIDAFINALKEGKESPISPNELIEISEWTIKADKF